MEEGKKETQNPNIFQRMLAIAGEVQTVPKNLRVSAGKGSYQAVGEADVLRSVKSIEAKHGVYSYPYRREIVEAGQLSKQSNGYESKQFYLRLHVVYRFVNADNPEEFIDVDSYGDGVDTGDKAPGKAMTYADKYALLKAYKMVTGEDPDQDASEEYNGYERQDRPKAEPMASDETKAEIKRLMAEKQIPSAKFNFVWKRRVEQNGMTASLANEILDWIDRTPSPKKAPDEEKAG